MSQDAPLVQFTKAVLSGNDQAAKLSVALVEGDAEAIRALFPADPELSDAMLISDEMLIHVFITYLAIQPEFPLVALHHNGGAALWYDTLSRLLEDLGGTVPNREAVLVAAQETQHAQTWPVLLELLPPILDTGHALMWVQGFQGALVFIAVTPDVARCWDGVAIPIGDQRIVTSAALDAAEDYILAERPDWAMLLRGTPPILAEPGQACPALAQSGAP